MMKNKALIHADPWTLRWLAQEYEDSATWLLELRSGETAALQATRAQEEAAKLRVWADRCEHQRGNLRERLAAYAHEAWSGWMKYLFDKSAPEKHGGTIIPGNLTDRWLRQMNTPYSDLPEEEKESDRIEADKMLRILSDLFQAVVDMHYIARHSNRKQVEGAAECLRLIQREAEKAIPELAE